MLYILSFRLLKVSVFSNEKGLYFKEKVQLKVPYFKKCGFENR